LLQVPRSISQSSSPTEPRWPSGLYPSLSLTVLLVFDYGPFLRFRGAKEAGVPSYPLTSSILDLAPPFLLFPPFPGESLPPRLDIAKPLYRFRLPPAFFYIGSSAGDPMLLDVFAIYEHTARAGGLFHVRYFLRPFFPDVWRISAADTALVVLESNAAPFFPPPKSVFLESP